MVLYLPYWVTKNVENEEITLFNWANNYSVNIYDKSHPAYKLLDSDHINVYNNEYEEDVNWLVEAKFLVLANNYSDRFSESKRFSNDTLDLILLPAGEACNLNCIYCYEDHNDKSRMKSEHVDILLNLVKNQNKKNLKLEYFGGEPMLNMNFIKKFSKSLFDNNIQFSGAITTNGTLINKERLDELYQANIKSFQITLDGPRERHNLLRASNSKSLDSFDVVINALKTIVESSYEDIVVTLRINVNHHSIEKYNFEKLIAVIESTVPKNDPRFFILPKAIGDYSSANLRNNEEAKMEYCKTSTKEKEVLQVFEDYIAHNYNSANVMLLTKQGGYSCYAGDPNSLVITPDLKVRKCTVALNDPINTVGFIDKNGIYQKNENLNLWIKDYSDKYCNTCIAQKTCQGSSCPLANIKANKKICPPIKQEINVLTQQVVKFYDKFN